MASSAASPPLVWVTQGKSQHAAHLLETKEETCVIRWNSTNTVDEVPRQNVVMALTPRRRRRPIVDECFTNDENDENQSMDVDESSSPVKKSGNRRKTPQQSVHEKEKDDNSEDEVQVLLTILPPTPKRPKKKQTKEDDEMNCMTTETRRVSTSPQPNNDNESTLSRPKDDCEARLFVEEAPPRTEAPARSAELSADDQESSALEELIIDSVAHSSAELENQTDQKSCSMATTANDDSERTFSLQSSAYVQNLAEICYTILNDGRWRVKGPLNKRLFAWEHGEDLSAVQALSKLYDPPTRPLQRKCPCILCRDKEEEKNNEIDMSVDTGDDECSEQPSLDSLDNVDEATIQCLHLYCRLYNRKGPWFRIDDIYKCYYAPIDSSTPEEEENDKEQECMNEDALRERRDSFFQPSSSSQSKKPQTSGTRQSTKEDGIIDQSMLEEHLSRISVLLRDVDHLIEMGLARNFHDEEECGRTAGSVTPDGKYGVLLTKNQRRRIVGKLGGSSKKEKKRATSASTKKQAPLVTRENIILKQMREQRTISFVPQPSSSKGTKSLNPVRRHVDDLLLDRLAQFIVTQSRLVGNIPNVVLYPAVADAKRRIRAMQRSGSSYMCLKLREAPLLALRRCARLFLCATSGPGDMRGDGTNAWRSLSDFDIASIRPDIPFPTYVQPPGSYSWYRVVHPGQSHRFGLASFPLIGAHEFLKCQTYGDTVSTNFDADPSKSQILQAQQVFNSVEGFRLWELCIEVRAHVDYHIELHEMLAYSARKRAREDKNEKDNSSKEGDVEVDSSVDGDTEAEANPYPGEALTTQGSVLDFLDVLTVSGRNALVTKLLGLSDAGLHVDAVCDNIERAISHLNAFIDAEKKRAKSPPDKIFQFDSERILVVFAVIISYVLVIRNQCITCEELASKQSRPWLRHLWPCGILAYALWDCTPLLERKGLYELACSCLEVLLFGKMQNRDLNLASENETGSADCDFDRTPLSHLLLSRRTRGKAHERLMIDYVHLLRWKQKKDPASGSDDSKARAKPQDVVQKICGRIVGALARAGTIPFSAVRNLARKVKRPLSKSLKAVPCAEVEALGIRLDNGNDSTTEGEDSQQTEKYVDWIPPTDFAVANALAGEGTIVGKRCSYVGFEEDATEKADTSSWNVEELAMQYYSSGRLPISTSVNDELAGGGWVGWHDEGGHVRALFRIICAHAILGMDSGCGKDSRDTLEYLEKLTIHLTPYQGAPFDLHVGHWEHYHTDDKGILDSSQCDTSVRSFYQRRRIQIDRFLNELESLTAQDLSDLVYDSIVCRLGQGHLQHALIVRDLQRVRVLSALAAGFGGQLLSAMFRCLLFDYRHYSGGLPDLLLMRALSDNDTDGGCTNTEETKPKSLVDLGIWIGEEFSAEAKMECEAAARSCLLIDKDDEFLGCSKVGDSGCQSSSQWRRGAPRKQSRDTTERTTDFDQPDATLTEKLPPRLVLRHNGQNVQVECLFVEVKSQNDRLDARQEDWLNVLDRVGNARVCKFGSGKKSTKKEGHPK